MPSIEELLQEGGAQIRADRAAYRDLEPAPPARPRRRLALLAVSAAVLIAGVFGWQAWRGDFRRVAADEEAYAALVELTNRTQAWAENLPQRTERPRLLDQIESRFEADRQKLRQVALKLDWERLLESDDSL